MNATTSAVLLALTALTGFDPARAEATSTTRTPPYDVSCVSESITFRLGVRETCHDGLPGRQGIVSHTNMLGALGWVSGETGIVVEIPNGVTVTATAHFRGAGPMLDGSTFICLQLKPFWSRTTPPATCERIPDIAFLAWPVTMTEIDPGPGPWQIRAYVRAAFPFVGQSVMRVEEISVAIG